MEKSRFFNSSNGDRKYLAEDFAEYFSSILSNGVFLHEANALKVAAYSALTISIATGKAYINGYAYQNTTALQKTLETVTANRIDRIAVRMDMTTRNILIVVKKGTPATTPAAPALIRSADIWELGIADINLVSGTTVITAAMITDLRTDKTYCGGVTMTVDRDEVLGDLDRTFTTFTEAASRANIITNETTPTIFGKIKKWFTDLKALAFKASVAAADIDSNAVTSDKIASNAVITAKINNAAITDEKVATGIAQSKISGLTSALAAAATQTDIATAINTAATARQQYIDYAVLNKPFTVGSSGTRVPLTLLSGKTSADIIGIGFRVTIGGDAYHFEGIKNSYNNTSFYLVGYRHFYLSGNRTFHIAVGDFGIDNSNQFYCSDFAIFNAVNNTTSSVSSGNLYYINIIYK